ncbi:CHAD domain-containing protein [Pricia sp. S334]|uniref:CHAD domain-containing protein n=1 Tax=Pricia mediterranea TaxID=3076079 RepID=A0ABU3L8R1_9FLAO|nr:CHAD domain-containing protein [Pricia sp. S334]MDT7829768.1 CHAD domain-containing protein [Pricia sp. S334]
MNQLEKTHWIFDSLSKTTDKACKKSLKLLKTENVEEFEEAVPQLRDNYKTIRAALRLVRDDYKNYKKENEFYRDEAKKVLNVQQSIAMAKAVALINEQYSDRLYKNAFTDLQDKLDEHRRQQIETALNEDHIFQEMHQNLQDQCEVLKDDISNPISRNTVLSGLKRVYKRGRKAQEKLSDSQAHEDFHELQKRTNYLSIQMGMLREIWPDIVDPLKSELEKLSQLLVTSEGLYQLSVFLRNNADMDNKDNGVYLMNTLIEGHREQVQQHAKLLAKKVFSLKPKHFRKYIETAWDAHEAESAQQMLPSEKLKLSK